MSNYVSGLVFKNAPYEDDRFKLLVALADWSDDDGKSHPSLIKLARKARVSYRNTIDTIKRLETEKIGAVEGQTDSGQPMLRVIRYRKKGFANDYFINIHLLESLPYYWPKALLERVQGLGATVAPHTSCHDPSCDHAQQDVVLVSHDEERTVENSGESFAQAPLLFPDLEAPAAVVDFAGQRAIPAGSRYVRDETDPGGWSSAEVKATAVELLGRELNHWDESDLKKIEKCFFSTQLTIYLLQKIRFKAKRDEPPPATLKYYRLSLEKLWKDCSFAVREVKYQAARDGLSREATFWLLNEEVLREISRWEHYISRS